VRKHGTPTTAVPTNHPSASRRIADWIALSRKRLLLSRSIRVAERSKTSFSRRRGRRGQTFPRSTLLSEGREGSKKSLLPRELVSRRAAGTSSSTLQAFSEPLNSLLILKLIHDEQRAREVLRV